MGMTNVKDAKIVTTAEVMAIAMANKKKTASTFTTTKNTISPSTKTTTPIKKQEVIIDFTKVKTLDQLQVDDGMLEVMLSNTAMDSFVSSECGFPHGTNILISGDPGVGKTSVLLNFIADIKKHSGKRVLFICAEMSKRMMLKYKKRFPKFGIIETMFPNEFEGQDLKQVYEQLFDNGYDLVLIDSVKELLSHIRQETNMTESAADTWLADLCVKHNYGNNKMKKYTSFCLIQQVTKAGVMVGKNVLKHITDGHLSLKRRKPKDGGGSYMIWEKNRNGIAGIEFSYSIEESKIIYYGTDENFSFEEDESDLLGCEED
jgi:predicted ATP-dependent serine protease